MRIKTGFICAVVLMLGMTVAAPAATQINWGHLNVDKFFLNSGGTAYGDALVSGSIVQLIYSSDQTIGAISNLDPFDPSLSGDELITSSTIGTHPSYPGSAGVFYVGAYSLPSSAYQSGYCYMRVFQKTSTSVSGGETVYYAQGPASGSTISTGHPVESPPNTPPWVDLAGTAGGMFMPMDLSVTVVPEPGTMALFGLGLLTVALRRKMIRRG